MCLVIVIKQHIGKMEYSKIKTLGQLKKSGYVTKSIKTEMRDNLIIKFKNNEKTFEGIVGYDTTVIPDIERGILSGHNLLFLGLRGQAKTRMARQMTELLDEYIPIIEGSEINDDPLDPISRYGIDKIATEADKTPIAWIHRSERYVEKLATPDVSIADLIGDVDPIKAANLKLSYSDERVIHFGLIPRANRSIFVINELPDLQPRIQVSLFNILQEGDIQIRGFKLRLPLDMSFVFTANPEDYTNRGSIITPLKDRIGSQILTHYPLTPELGMTITQQEAKINSEAKYKVTVPEIHRVLIEKIVANARKSEYTDEKSGVSARLGISALENLYSTAERRMLLNGESSTVTRISDFIGIIPSITGKIELVYEGEQEGPYFVAQHLISQSVKELFLEKYPTPYQIAKNKNSKDVYGVIKAFFSGRNIVELFNYETNDSYDRKLNMIAGLKKVAQDNMSFDDDILPQMELILFGLSETEVVNKNILDGSIEFDDPLSGMLGDLSDE